MKKKQIKDFYLSAAVQIAGVSVSGSSTDLSGAIATALSTAGDGNTQVPVQALGGANKVGVLITSPNNRCEVADDATGAKFASATEQEVYGRVTSAGAAYTLSFYTLEAGVETAYTFAAAVLIKVEFNYRFHISKLPADALISTRSRNVADDPVSAGDGKKFTETLTIALPNTLPDLTKLPSDGNDVTLTINDVAYKPVGAAPPFSIVGKVLTWNPPNAGFDLDSTDGVIADYYSKG
jgi:hypothetical protein